MSEKVKLSLIIIAGILLIVLTPYFLPFLFLAGMIYIRRKFPSIKGAIGEWYVNKELNKLGPIYRVFHDLYIPNGEGGTSQVDHVVTSPFGIFVIETKHYDGWIFGKETQRLWTQVIYKRKEKFLNPIWQNYGHIEVLKKQLGDHSFHSLIVFSSRSTLKFEDNFNSARVIQIPQITRVIKEWTLRQVSNQDLHTVNQTLEQLTINDPRQKRLVHKHHVEAIKNKQKKPSEKPHSISVVNTSSDSSTPCPKCGGQLKKKKGKYGAFYGCSQYPACRYTEKVS